MNCDIKEIIAAGFVALTLSLTNPVFRELHFALELDNALFFVEDWDLPSLCGNQKSHGLTSKWLPVKLERTKEETEAPKNDAKMRKAIFSVISYLKEKVEV